MLKFYLFFFKNQFREHFWLFALETIIELSIVPIPLLLNQMLSTGNPRYALLSFAVILVWLIVRMVTIPMHTKKYLVEPVKKIASEYYKSILYASRNNNEDASKGEIQELYEGNTVISIELLELAVMLMLSISKVLVASAICFFINPAFVLLGLLPSFLMLPVQFHFSKKIYPMMSKFSDSKEIVRSQLSELLDGVETIYAFDCYDFYQEHMAMQWNTACKYEMNYKTCVQHESVLLAIISTMYIPLVVIVGASLLFYKQISSASYVAAYSLIAFLSPLAISTIEQIGFMRESRYKAKELIERMPSPRNTPEQSGPVLPININNISVSFSGEKKLSKIIATINKGDRIAIIGETGAGKTLLMRTILGYNVPSEGDIIYGNTRLSCENRISISKTIRYCNQIPTLFNFSLIDNITFGSDEEYDSIKLLLSSIGLDSLLARFDFGLHQVIEPKAISSGESSRIAFARARFQEPELLLLDEFTTTVDTSTEDTVFSSMSTMLDTTIVAITHRYSTIKHFNRVLIMDGGSIVFDGSVEKAHAEPIFRSLFKGQIA